MLGKLYSGLRLCEFLELGLDLMLSLAIRSQIKSLLKPPHPLPNGHLFVVS